MKRFNCGLLTLLIGLLAACGQAQSPPELPPVVDRVATVNGKPISKAEFEMYVANIERQANGRPLDPAQRAKVLDRFIGMHLAADAGEKNGLTKEQKIADELSFARTKVLSEAAMQKYLNEHPVKDEELKPAYEAGVAKLPLQYHTSHIVVADSAAATELIKQLNGGANFAKLARKQSTHQESKESGGDIGWYVPDDMAKPYAAAVAGLKAGEITQTPIQTVIGWHVIRLEEAPRPQETAPFEEVKDKVMLLLKQERLNTYLESLRKEAKIDLAEQRSPGKS